MIGDAPDRPGLAFAQVENYHPPTWPEGERPQFHHFDVRVEDLDIGEAAVLELEARRLEGAASGSGCTPTPSATRSAWCSDAIALKPHDLKRRARAARCLDSAVAARWPELGKVWMLAEIASAHASGAATGQLG